ncbi:MAG: hypothetical protein PHR44_02555 [Candidatus Omnitrophica bacterium]|nr:hypothetical protein [Candidatus Omnitrophota bacterium]
MQISELVGKLVLFKFSEEIRHGMSLFQIYKDELWAMVTGVDDIGVWLENSAYELGVWWDEQGNMVPPDKQVKEKVKSHIFIPWRYIEALMSVEDERFQKVRSERLPGFKDYR